MTDVLFCFSAHLQRLSSSSAVTPADTLRRDSACAHPFVLPFQISHCPRKQKTGFFCATWSSFPCNNEVESECC